MDLLIAGDFCPNARLGSRRFEQDEIVSDSIRAIINESDYSIVNLECPVVDSDLQPILKQGPSLKCFPEALAYLKRVGFSAVSLANNHIRDYGDEGLLNTIAHAENNGLDYVGAGSPNDTKRERLLFSSEGETVAIINCCEKEFSVTDDHSIGTNPLDVIRQFHQIKKAKELADYVVVIVHGGVEHFQYPTPRMRNTYRFYIEAGADAVVNHHQHCFSGYEVYEGKPIFYGLGNFCFDWEGKRNLPWNQGFMVKLKLQGSSVAFDLYPYSQCNDEAIVELMDANDSALFQDRVARISETITKEGALEAEVNHYFSNTDQEYEIVLEPYSSRIGMALYRRNLVPSFISKKRILKLCDFVMCESHRERLEAFLNKQYSKIEHK